MPLSEENGVNSADNLSTQENRANKKSKNALGIIVNILLVVFVVFVFASLSISLLSQKGYSLFGYRSFIVLTGSMSPTFNANSYIITKETPTDDIKVGDIISFKDSQSDIVTHRVTKIVTGLDVTTFVTKGDANNMEDLDPVSSGNVLGVAVFWVNGLGGFLLSLHDWKNLVICVVILIIIFFIPDMIRFLFKKDKTVDKQGGSKVENRGKKDKKGDANENKIEEKNEEDDKETDNAQEVAPEINKDGSDEAAAENSRENPDKNTGSESGDEPVREPEKNQ
ncbi:MAG: signal peptidase I [Defluviitaleaceae bacterium]|nr:signal peptidase I [Defluviitaleaceae bacterium]